MEKRPQAQVKTFSSPKKWRAWLAKNHSRFEGVWLRLFKQGSGKKMLSHAEALNEALCFGWIDGQGKKYDEESWIIKFTPRRKKSIWSKRNQEHVRRLIQAKRMTSYGLKEIERAKADGRWAAAYDSSRNMEVPLDFMNKLKKK